jgi:putative flippase GtrA
MPKEQKRFIKFLIVGGIGFVVDFGAFNILHSFREVPEIVAQAISFSLAVISNFAWNYHWIYREARAKPIVQMLSQFAVVSIVGLLVRTPIFAFMLPLTEGVVASAGLSWIPFNLGANLALACSVLIVLLWNFFVNRHWTYGDVPRA